MKLVGELRDFLLGREAPVLCREGEELEDVVRLAVDVEKHGEVHAVVGCRALDANRLGREGHVVCLQEVDDNLEGGNPGCRFVALDVRYERRKERVPGIDNF